MKKKQRKTIETKDLFVNTEMKSKSTDTTKSRILGYVCDPETFGEIGFLINSHATARIVADSELVQVLEVDKAMLNIAFHKYPELAARFYHYLGTSLLRLISSSLTLKDT